MNNRQKFQLNISIDYAFIFIYFCIYLSLASALIYFFNFYLLWRSAEVGDEEEGVCV